MAKSAKGRDAEGATVAEARWARLVDCVVVLDDTLALVVGLLIALSTDAINQLPIASVYDHKINKNGSVCERGAQLLSIH